MAKRVGNYEIIDKIGQGGMGAVFKARQTSMDRIVALKVLPPKLAKDRRYVQRFLREAKSAGQVSHPNLIGAYDYGEADGYTFFSMEFIDGPSLRQVNKERGPLPEAEVIGYMQQIAAALGAAHDQGIVHRDVKPDNVLLTPAGDVKLGDLGLAKPMSGDADVTMGGRAIGTPAFMSPEQAKGEDCDGRSDLYSLACTAFTLLTGEFLFKAPTGAGINVKQVTEKPRPIRDVRPDISAGMEQILLRLLDKKPERRYRDAAELIVDLQALATGTFVARPAGGRGTRSGGRRASPVRAAGDGPPMGLLLGGGTAVVLLVVIIAVVSSGGDHPPREPIAVEEPASEPAVREHTEPPIVEAATRSTEENSKDQNAAEMLAFARQHWQQHPTAFAEVQSYFQRAQQAGAGTVVELQVDQELQRLEAAWVAHAGQQWRPYLDRVEAALAAGDFDAAAAVLTELQGPWVERLGPAVSDQQRAIARQGDQAVDVALAAAQKLVGTQDLDAADAALAATVAVAWQPGQQRVAAELARLQKEQTRLRAEAEDEAVQAAKRLLGPAVEAFITALADGPRAADRVIAERLQDPAHAPIRTELRSLKGVSQAFIDRKNLLRRSFEEQMGQQITVATSKGEQAGLLKDFYERGSDPAKHGLRIVRAVDPAKPAAGTVTILIRWSELLPSEVAARTGTWRARSPADHIALALMAGDDADAIDAAIDQAGDHPLAPWLARRVAEQRLGAANLAAREAWDAQLAPLVERRSWTPEQARAAETTTLAWHAAHAEAAVYRQELREAYEILLARLQRAQITDFIVNGGFETGDLSGWGVFTFQGQQEQGQVVDGGRNGGKALHYKPYLSWLQEVSLEPGKRYRLSYWLKVLDPGKGQIGGLKIDGQGLPEVRVSEAGDWLEREHVFVAERERYELGFFTNKPDVHALIDDVSLREIPAD